MAALTQRKQRFKAYLQLCTCCDASLTLLPRFEQDGESAEALRCWARAITTDNAHDKLRHDSSRSATAQSGVNGDDLATSVASRSPLALHDASSSKKHIFSDLLAPPGSGLSSFDGCLEKLANERRKWMITLYRARNYKRPAERPRRQKTQEPSSTQTIVVQAADFCHRCGSIVDVGLERTADAAAGGGVFVAEHRSGCSSCENDQHNRRAINSSPEAPRFCRKGILHRCHHLYRGRQPGQVNA